MLTPNEENKVIALLARGESMSEVARVMQADGKKCDIQAVRRIRNTNQIAIDNLKTTVRNQQLSKSANILDKSQHLIEKKLDRINESDAERDKLKQRYLNTEITYTEYRELLSSLETSTLTELNSVARDAFTQTQLESGKPTTITNEKDAKTALKQLVSALESDDEIELQRIVFKKQ